MLPPTGSMSVEPREGMSHATTKRENNGDSEHVGITPLPGRTSLKEGGHLLQLLQYVIYLRLHETEVNYLKKSTTIDR